jgi:hypothetical protein
MAKSHSSKLHIVSTSTFEHRWALLLCQVMVTSLRLQSQDKLYRLHHYQSHKNGFGYITTITEAIKILRYRY